MRFLFFSMLMLVFFTSCSTVNEAGIVAEIRIPNAQWGTGIMEFESIASDLYIIRAVDTIIVKNRKEINALKKNLAPSNFYKLPQNWYETGYPERYRESTKNWLKNLPEGQKHLIKSCVAEVDTRIVFKRGNKKLNDTIYVGTLPVNAYYLGEANTDYPDSWMNEKRMQNAMYIIINGEYYVYTEEQLAPFLEFKCAKCDGCSGCFDNSPDTDDWFD